MSPSSSTTSLSIGSVVEQLSADFPDLTISKVRFLESEGLLAPARSAAGYRRYGPDDVDRLRYILLAQRDRFWPLKVIGEALDAMDRGLTVADDLPVARPPRLPDDGLPTAADFEAVDTLRLTSKELRDAAGLTRAELDELVSFGLVAERGTGRFDADALRIAQVVAQLRDYGIEARHLRPFRTAADREIGLVDQALGPRRRHGGDPRAEPDPRSEILALLVTLRTTLVRAGVADRP